MASECVCARPVGVRLLASLTHSLTHSLDYHLVVFAVELEVHLLLSECWGDCTALHC